MEFIGGRLDAKRLKRFAELIDRLFVRSRTTVAHCSGWNTIHRKEAGIGIEAQRKKEHDKRAGQNRKGTMRMDSHSASLSLSIPAVNHVSLHRAY